MPEGQEAHWEPEGQDGRLSRRQAAVAKLRGKLARIARDMENGIGEEESKQVLMQDRQEFGD